MPTQTRKVKFSKPMMAIDKWRELHVPLTVSRELQRNRSNSSSVGRSIFRDDAQFIVRTWVERVWVSAVSSIQTALENWLWVSEHLLSRPLLSMLDMYLIMMKLRQNKIVFSGTPTDTTSDPHQTVVSLKDLSLKVMQASALRALLRFNKWFFKN